MLCLCTVYGVCSSGFINKLVEYNHDAEEIGQTLILKSYVQKYQQINSQQPLVYVKINTCFVQFGYFPHWQIV